MKKILTKESIEKMKLKNRLKKKLSEETVSISDGINTYNLTKNEFNSVLNEAINNTLKKRIR